ncbi:hypothetical protein GCM10010994_60710 [Chelatococcus reniformis]|uniref:N-acetylmuramoyl-L-alanine amidase domain-containing protein n=1 Tax=Chelatococcus reniformis TaxID=1494448 RepID=A0A916UZ33_9HYPH|nr:hypothetical protein GCM10010994_60710 [Chelatococcus reniformis]
MRALAEPAPQPSPSAQVVLASWMPTAKMLRIILHWSAGTNKASGLDKSHDHILIESDGNLVRGVPSIDKNDPSGTKSGYAAHTLNCNTGSIGASLCGMSGAVESPFSRDLRDPTWREEAREVGALAQPGDAPLDRADAGVPVSLAIAVALRKALRALLAEAGPGQAADLQLHQPLGGKADHLAQRSASGLFSGSPRRFIISSVIGRLSGQEWISQPNPTGDRR